MHRVLATYTIFTHTTIPLLLSVLQPYVPAYDTVPQYRIPDWIAETVHTRNVVTVNQTCVDYVRTIQEKLLQYRNEPDEYMKGTG